MSRNSICVPSLTVIDCKSQAELDLAALPPVRPAGLYVHVPFCFHKCHYCDFYSITRQTPGRMARFVDLVLAEADLWAASLLTLRPDTVFFGGGTPSLLPIGEMDRLLSGMAERFDLSGVREWTVEVNPATADAAYLRMMRRRGVDRISFGAQSFDAAELAMLERHHAPADVPAAVAMAREAGFDRLSIDLIYAIPGQSMESWQRSLAAAVALDTGHLSCYGLTYEANTPLTVRRRLGRVVAAEEGLEVAMFRECRRRLAEVGLPAYEVSNYARPGCESLHNLGYWTGESYLGLGPSAASHVEGRRFRNQPHLGRWEESIAAGAPAAIEYEHLSPRQRAGELAMLNLRLARGIDLGALRQRTGVDGRALFSDQAARLSAIGLLEDTGGHLRLTDKAWPVADAVAAEFLEASCATHAG